ncbi:MAG: hypothetical protein FJ297_08165 [Planctomycetes bacterium]|nr:hypothetical protein [Planctomycetota bacterium]
MISQKAQDAAFFDMVHELIRTNQLLQDPQSVSKGAERRMEKRISYPYVQLMAPFDGKTLPSQSDFRHVYCNDISTRGFSYFESPLPTYRQVVMLFGKLPFRVFTAEVRHVQKTANPEIFLIGCRILSRIKS